MSKPHGLTHWSAARSSKGARKQKRAPGHSTPQLQHQALRLRYDEGMAWDQIERVTGYSKRQMQRWAAKNAHQYAAGVALTVNPKLPSRGIHALSMSAQEELVRSLLADPELYYEELMYLVYARTGEAASLSTIKRVCKAAGFRCKVTSPVSPHRNPYTMRVHAQLRQQYHFSQLVFIDEAHKRGKDLARKKGKAQGNHRVYTKLTDHLARNWTMIAAMNYTGCIAHKVVELGDGPGCVPSMDRERWLAYFEAFILPMLGNAANGEPNSVVVIDNASLHWGGECALNELVRLCATRGALVVYTPPYCPRANAIEAMFKGMNDYIRANRSDAQSDPQACIERGLEAAGRAGALQYVLRSQEDVEKWLDGRGVH